MKNLILFSVLTLLSFFGFSQTPIDVYVINPNGCPYSITSTWTSPLGGGTASVISVDSLINQEIWHLEISDSSNQTMLSVCTVPAPPCNCPMECMGPISTFPNMAITLILCNTINVDELEVLTIQNPLVGFVVFPLSEPTTFYLINSESKIIKWGKNTTTPSFDSEDLQSGIYNLVLETPKGKKIFKLIK